MIAFQKYQASLTSNSNASNAVDNSTRRVRAHLYNEHARILTHRVVIPREDIKTDEKAAEKYLDNAYKIMKAHCKFNRKSKLEFEFKGEVGTGTGPTVEFYSRCADFLRMKKFDLFMNQSSDTDEYFVENIFPKPENCISEEKKVKWWLLGCLIGKLLLEKRYLDIPLSTCLLKIISKKGPTTTDDKMTALKCIDPVRFDLLNQLSSFSNDEISSMCLNMTYNDCPLVENGENIDLSSENVEFYWNSLLKQFLYFSARYPFLIRPVILFFPPLSVSNFQK